jgi:hypothetical protein
MLYVPSTAGMYLHPNVTFRILFLNVFASPISRDSGALKRHRQRIFVHTKVASANTTQTYSGCTEFAPTVADKLVS